MIKNGDKSSAVKIKTRKKKSKKVLNGHKKTSDRAIPMSRITFRLPKEAVPHAQIVTIVGDFNNWDLTEAKMRKLESGDFELTMELPCNREYSFRYIIDSHVWEKEWFADRHIPDSRECPVSLISV